MAFGGPIDGGKIFLGDDVGIQMKHKVVRFGVHVGKSFLRRARAALELNVSRIVVAHGGLGQIFLLGRIEPLEAEKRDIRLAHKRRLSPEAHQLRGASAQNVGDDHAVNTAGGRGRRRVQVGIAIEPKQA